MVLLLGWGVPGDGSFLLLVAMASNLLAMASTWWLLATSS